MAVEFGTKNKVLAAKKWAANDRMRGWTYGEIQFAISAATGQVKELRELSADELDLLVAYLDGEKKEEVA